MSKPLSAVDCIGPAFTQTKEQLFSPFRFQRWTRLALVCLILGDFAGGGGGSPGGFNFPVSHSKSGKTLFAIPNIDWDRVLPWLPWIATGIALVLVLFFLWIYIASVYRFVLFDSVLHNRCELKGCWRRWEPRGRSFFFWCLAIIVGFLAAYAVLIGAPLLVAWQAGLFRHPGEHVVTLIFGGIAMLLLILTFFVAGAVAVLFAKDFCVPIMALENVGVLDAWRRLLPMLAVEKMAFTGYVLMKIVLSIGSAIIFGIITIITLIALLIPLGIIALIVFFGGKALGLSLDVATVSILVLLGGIILMGIIYLIALISTPAMVFFQSYVLHFLGSRYPALGAELFPPPPENPPPPILDGPPMLAPSIG